MTCDHPSIKWAGIWEWCDDCGARGPETFEPQPVDENGQIIRVTNDTARSL